MRRMPLSVRTAALAAAALLAGCATVPPTGPMSFFVTSVGLGKGADLGGLSGADAHCQNLAMNAGAGKRQWRAYLSNSATQTAPAVHARDRIGKGPWYNAKGVLVAANLEELHGNNNITKATALSESGATINGRGDTPNMHDVLTGSRPDGTALSPNPNMTCGNWTQSGDGAAIVGHHDRTGLTTDPWSLSWNSSHQSRGCSMDQLKASGGAGLFYCFAAD